MAQIHSFSVISFLRENKKKDDLHTPVYLRITVDGKRCEISTKTFTSKLLWNSAKGRVKGNSEETRAINHTIQSFETRARAVYSNLIEKGKVVTAEIIKNEILGFEEKVRTLYAFFVQTLSEMKEKLNNGYSAGTLKNWEVTRGHLKEFISMQY
ncbi:MAG: Arm DNA-binding domain-containing protein, partial [Ferruginibacter sp.]